MNPAWEQVRQHLISHSGVYLGALSAMLIAAVCTMPEMFPKSMQEWWTWSRNALQTAVPAARARQESHSQITVATPTTTTTQEASSSSAVPTSPATPAQPK